MNCPSCGSELDKSIIEINPIQLIIPVCKDGEYVNGKKIDFCSIYCIMQFLLINAVKADLLSEAWIPVVRNLLDEILKNINKQRKELK